MNSTAPQMPRFDDEDLAHARAWLAAAGDPAAVAEIDAVYQIIADQIAARRPLCEASGRCCNFRGHGHLLYVTGLEAAATVRRARAAGVAINEADIAAARERGDCPYLVEKLCGVHGVKPLGCRVYFCDPTAQDWQQDLSERTLEMMRSLHTRRAVPYRYAEWRWLLSLVVAAGA